MSRAMSGREPRSASGCPRTSAGRACSKRPREGRVERMTPTLLIVDDEKPTRGGLRAAFEDRFDVYVAEDAATAMELLERENFAVMLTDFKLPKEDGMKLIARAKSLSKPPVCILMTA